MIRQARLFGGLVILLATLACARPPAPATPGTRSAPASSQPAPLTIEPARPAVLEPVHVSAEGLPPNSEVAIDWHTVDGGWAVSDYYRFLGKRFEESVQPWATARTDADGRLSVTLTVPEDYGGVHEVTARVGDVEVARGAVDVVQSFSISATEGPVGSPIEITARGLGWRTMESTWVLLWDNQSMGFLSAVDTRGTATARLRAAGQPGPHHLKLWSGWQGQAYLNPDQAPTWYLPRPEWTYTITDEPVTLASYVEPYPDQRLFALTAIGRESGATITPAQGPIQTAATLSARGLPPGQVVDIVWERMVGNRVEAAGFSPQGVPLGTATVGADGSLQFSFEVPDDLGGAHPVRIMADGRELARAVFAVETSLVSVTPSVVRRGEPFEIQLKGVGWTEYDNILNVTYDNAYVGYACGFTSQGDVLIRLTATGAPGVHLVDLYPGIFKGPADMPQQLYRLPQLTYRDDHPGNRLPAIRVAIEVTDD